jgi:hypothetical protein
MTDQQLPPRPEDVLTGEEMDTAMARIFAIEAVSRPHQAALVQLFREQVRHSADTDPEKRRAVAWMWVNVLGQSMWDDLEAH